MKIKVYVIDLESPPWLRKGLAYVVPALIVLGMAAVVVAAPVQWGSNETLTAAKMNSITVVTTDAGVSYSVGATTYCGTGPSPTTGSITYNGLSGYQGAKAMCQGSSGCGMSPTAHMCTADEVLRSAQLGISMGGGWFSTMSWAFGPPNTTAQTDCKGWTSASTDGDLGTIWTGSYPTDYGCSGETVIMCCD